MSGLQYDGIPLDQPMKSEQVMECRGERRFHWQSALLLESVRRQTFTNWTVTFVNADQLARAGFFYLRTQDHVQCVFCQGIVGFWDPGDQPELEHAKHFPRCPFVTGSATGNVPATSPDTHDPVSQLYALLDKYHAFKVASTRPHLPSTTYQTDATLVGTGGHLAFPLLNTSSSRLATFTRWPQDVGVSGEQLAEAGFFSTGLADWVQCFHCGGGLYGWRRGDDPVEDHASFYPSCPFIRTKRGEAIDTSNIKNTCLDSAPTRALTLSQQEADLLLQHPMAQRLVGMGLSRISVKEALKLRLEARGVLCRTVTEGLELVFDYEEDQRKKTATSCHDGPQLPAQGENQIPPSDTHMQVGPSQHFHSTTSIQDKHSPHASSDHSKLLQEVEALRQLVLEEERRLLCRLCRTERVSVVFQPCSHLHLCADCARPRDTCSTCGTIVRGTFRPIIG